MSFNSEYGVHLCTDGKCLNVIASGDGPLFFSFQNTHMSIVVFLKTLL